MGKKIVFSLFPEGKRKALTLSYDDGHIQDRRLVKLFNQYGLKATFHLNSGGCEHCISADEIPELYSGHEVAVHTVSHPDLTVIPKALALQEVLQDREQLEAAVGYPVCGMSYPYGTCNDAIVALLEQRGIVYSRTTASTESFELPNDYLRWHPSCHHSRALPLLQRFKAESDAMRPQLFYVWGHSHELDRNIPDNNWEMMEEFCRAAGGNPDMWYATNMEIYEYDQALQRLLFSADATIVKNPSALDVWLSVDGLPVKIAAGQTVSL